MSDTTAPELRFVKSGAGAILRHLSPSYLIRINAAWRQFQTFKALDADRLHDLGLTSEQQRAATFADFCQSRGH